MTVTLIRGRIGTGKTFLANRICVETGALLLSTDGFTKHLFKNGCPGRAHRLEVESAVLSFFLELAAANAEQGRPTVIDHGFWRRCELDSAVAYLEARGIDYEVRTLEASFETRLERVQSRENGISFTKEKLLELDKYFEE